LAAPAVNAQLDTGADGGPVVPTLTSMPASTAAAGPGLREIRDDLVLRGRRLAMEDLPKSCVHLRGNLGEVHRGERLCALVLHERGVGAIRSAQKPSALQPVDLAKQPI